MLGRLIGRLLLLGALVALAYDAFVAFEGGPFSLSALGALWAQIDFSSLNATQAFVQRYLFPWLWDPAIQTWLTWPAVLALGAPGLLLVLLFRRRGDRRIFQR